MRFSDDGGGEFRDIDQSIVQNSDMAASMAVAALPHHDIVGLVTICRTVASIPLDLGGVPISRIRQSGKTAMMRSGQTSLIGVINTTPACLFSIFRSFFFFFFLLSLNFLFPNYRIICFRSIGFLTWYLFRVPPNFPDHPIAASMSDHFLRRCQPMIYT
jgi:hypothetical protein